MQRKDEFEAIRTKVQAMSAKLSGQGVEDELKRELKRIRGTEEFRSPRFPAQESFEAALNSQLQQFQRNRSSKPSAVKGAVQRLQTALTTVQASTEVELKDQVDGYAKKAYEALEEMFLARLQSILDESKLSFSLPSAGALRVGQVSLARSLAQARYQISEEYTANVKKTRSKWNPKRWFGDKYYWEDEIRTRPVEKIDFDQVLADAREQLRLESGKLQIQVDDRYKRSLDGVEKWVERVAADARTAFKQLARQVEELTRSQEAAARKLKASEKRQQAYKAILRELDTIIKGPFSC